MEYYKQMITRRKNGLESMSDNDLYDEANAYHDFEHGPGYYTQSQLIQMILNYEYKMPLEA